MSKNKLLDFNQWKACASKDVYCTQSYNCVENLNAACVSGWCQFVSLNPTPTPAPAGVCRKCYEGCTTRKESLESADCDAIPPDWDSFDCKVVDGVCQRVNNNQQTCDSLENQFYQEAARLNSCELDVDCAYAGDFGVKPDFFNCGYPLHKNSDLTRLRQIAQETKSYCVITPGGCPAKSPLWCKQLDSGKKVCYDLPKPA